MIQIHPDQHQRECNRRQSRDNGCHSKIAETARKGKHPFRVPNQAPGSDTGVTYDYGQVTLYIGPPEFTRCNGRS